MKKPSFTPTRLNESRNTPFSREQQRKYDCALMPASFIANDDIITRMNFCVSKDLVTGNIDEERLKALRLVD